MSGISSGAPVEVTLVLSPVRRVLLTVGLGLVTLGCQTLSPLFWNCAQSMVG